MKITPIIGLEVHVELKTKSKMFCGCDAEHFHVEPNTHTCPVCLGLPGALPVPNKTACEWCIKIGLALNCQVNKRTFFERKNYFYPDLAKGYQITQYQKPFTINGWLDVDGKKIRINRAHMEEDTGKSQYQMIEGENCMLLDFNRSGVPLVEIVSEPDIDSAETAKKYLQKIQQIIRYLEVSDADIEKGSMRCEPTVNLKIEKDGKEYFTPLAEIKNIASLSGAEIAINYEIKRQQEEWEKTGEVKNKTNKTTRGYDATKKKTFLQRQKEGSADYRYFPEPDIPPIEFSDSQIEDIQKTIQELPEKKERRYEKDYGLSEYDSKVIADDLSIVQAFEKAIGQSMDKDFVKFCVNLFLGVIKKHLNETQSEIEIQKINSDDFHTIYEMVKKNDISSTSAKDVILESYKKGIKAAKIIEERGLKQVSDTSELETIAQKILDENPKVRDDFKKNPNSIGFLVGQAMKASKGVANPQVIKEIFIRLLSS